MPEPGQYIKDLLRTSPDLVTAIDMLNTQAWELRYTDVGASMDYSRKAMELAGKKKYPSGLAYARLYLAIGHFLRSENRQALELLLQVRKYFDAHQDEKGYPLTLTFTGNIYESFGDFETALILCQDALRKARESGYKEEEGEVQSVIGLIYSRLSDYNNALDAYHKSRDLRNELGDQKAVASSLNRIARIHTLMKHYDKALENYQKSLTLREQTGQLSALPWTYLGMASTFEEMGDHVHALAYYNKNLEDGCGDVDKRCRLQSVLGMGRVLSRMNKSDQAKQYLQDAIDMAEELDARPLQYEAHYALAQHFEATGMPAEALDHYKKYQKIREDVYNEESRNRMKNQQIAFAIEKSEKEKEIYHLRNVELKAAYDEIHQKNQEITDSINYASRIQAALLPRQEILRQALPEHFILFLPRDIVSGDFYWAAQADSKVVFCAADCTGHGVPGAFMSMLGITFLDEIVNYRNILKPDEILGQLRKEVIKALKQTGKEQEQKDGMDIALCVFDPADKRLEFAGAYNPLYLVRNGELEEYKADRMPISIYDIDWQPFHTQSMDIQKGDMIYIFSDGYADQFGGTEGKKYKYKTLKEFLLRIYKNSVDAQHDLLKENLISWKGNFNQIDDILLMGVRF
jgi:serine phosphatase RsbU (regulator of sigma subunit)